MFKLEKAKNGDTTLKYNNKYVHSKYNPKNEAKQFAIGNKELIDKNICVLYGLGLGYHIHEIIKIKPPQSMLYIFEYSKEITEYCKKTSPEIFKNKGVTIIDATDNEFLIKLSKYIRLSGNLIIHKPSLEILKDLNETLYNLISDFSLSMQFNNIDTVYKKLQEDNYKINISRNDNLPIREFIKKFKSDNMPYIVTAAGPSLDFDLALLKEHRKSFKIVCVGSALRTLMNNGIKPDAIVIIDGKENVKKQFQGFENEDIPLCFKATASKWAVDIYNGPKYIFNVEDDQDVIEVRGTVAVSAIDIAIKSNAKKILLLGQDLAFIGEKSHTESFEKIYGFRDDIKSRVQTQRVKGVNGQILQTTRGLIGFKNGIEALIRANKNVQFINCSYGAQINGTDHMKLKDFIINNNL
ncbi:MAG: motility associated factor glycosyltransferase family protein [Clostridium butyricum]|nr:motility associated factor glycosyltransferase family protein [Clostridium butyricum]